MSRIHFSPDTTLNRESQALLKKEVAPSIFTKHELRAGKLNPHENHPFQPDWIFGVLLTGVILIVWSRVFYSNRLNQIIMAPISKRFISQLRRDGNLLNERISLAIGVIYILTFSLMLYQANELILGYSFWNIKGFKLYLLIVIWFIVFWVSKISLIQLVGSVFQTTAATHDYLLNTLLFCMINGILLLPLLICIVYLKSTAILLVALALSVLFFVFRFMKGFMIGLALSRFSYLFLFVYLCSLEILPLAVLIKLFLMITSKTGA